MLWFVLAIAIIGYFFYRLDKKLKNKFSDKFNPKEWDLPVDAIVPEVEATSVGGVAAELPDVIYEKKSAPFSEEERAFFGVLQAALHVDYIVLAKVKLGEVIGVSSNKNQVAWQAAIHKTNSKYVDFLVCSKKDLAPLCAIELLNKVNQPISSGDKLLGEICKSAGLTLLRFEVQPAYVMQELRNKILTALGVVTRNPVNTAALAAMQQEKVREEQETMDFKLCPKCSSIMLRRKAKSGVHEGKMFWTCSTYPACKGMLQID